MPWRNYASITKADALAIAAYLKTLPPVSHQVPGPFGPRETPTTFVMTVQPGSVYARLVNPPSPPPPPPASPQPSPLPPAPPEIAAPPPGLPAAPSPDLK
jgi:hypothetical protein